MIDGQLYVPASDVAKALSMNLSYKSGGSIATMVGSGGMNAAEGPQGKMDEVLFNGKTRLTLLSETESSSKGTVYTLEVRNAEAKPKRYLFGQKNRTQFSFYDESNMQVDASLVDFNKDLMPLVEPGTPYRAKWVVKIPEGFVAKKIVIRLGAQFPANPATEEVFRIVP